MCGEVVLHARARDHARFRACAHVWFVVPHSLVWKSRRPGALATGRARLSWGCMSPNYWRPPRHGSLPQQPPFPGAAPRTPAYPAPPLSRDPRRGQRPRHAHRTYGVRAGRGVRARTTYEASSFASRVVVVAPSSVRPVGCSETNQNSAITRKRGAPSRDATKSDPKSSASAFLRTTCLVAFFPLRCDSEERNLQRRSSAC